MIKFSSVIFLLCLLIAPTFAQDNPLTDFQDELCGEARLAVAVGLLRELADNIEASENPQLDLFELRVQVSTIQAVCDNLVFTSEDHGLSVVIDPFILLDGIYRVIVEGDDFMTVTSTEVAGDCDRFSEVLSSDQSRLESSFEAQDNCTLLLDVDARAPWSITFEPIVLVEG